MPDAADRRLAPPTPADGVRRPSAGRRVGTFARERTARIRARGHRNPADPRHCRPARTRPGRRAERRVQDAELARDAPAREPAELAASVDRVADAADPGGPAAQRLGIFLQRPVQHARRGASAGQWCAQTAAGGRGRRGRGTLGVPGPGRLRTAPRARRRCQSPARRGRADEPVRRVRGGRVRRAVGGRAGDRRGARGRSRRAAGGARRPAAWRRARAQPRDPDHGRRADRWLAAGDGTDRVRVARTRRARRRRARGRRRWRHLRSR